MRFLALGLLIVALQAPVHSRASQQSGITGLHLKHAGTRWRKVVDFGGKPEWVAVVQFEPIRGIDSAGVAWSDLRLLEAKDDRGRDLQPADPEDTIMPGFEPVSPSGYPLSVAIKVPERNLERIARLKVAYKVKTAKERRRYVMEKLDGPDGGRAEDEDFEVTVREPSEEDVPFVGNQPEVRIRPKRLAHAELANVPVTLVFKWDDMNGPRSTDIAFTGKGDLLLSRIWFISRLRPAKDREGKDVRRLLGLEVVIPIGVQERPMTAEYHEVSLK